MDDLLDGKIEAAGPEMTQDTMKIIDHFKGLEEAAKDYTKPDEEWCAELYDVQAQIKALQDREAKLKDVAKKWKEPFGTFIHGRYILKISERAGSKTLDKEALIERLTAELGEAEAQVYIKDSMKQGKASTVIHIEKVKSSGDPVGVGGHGESGL